MLDDNIIDARYGCSTGSQGIGVDISVSKINTSKNIVKYRHLSINCLNFVEVTTNL